MTTHLFTRWTPGTRFTKQNYRHGQPTPYTVTKVKGSWVYCQGGNGRRILFSAGSLDGYLAAGKLEVTP